MTTQIFGKYSNFVPWEAFFKQNNAIRQKSNILHPPKFFSPQTFGLATPLFDMHLFLVYTADKIQCGYEQLTSSHHLKIMLVGGWACKCGWIRRYETPDRGCDANVLLLATKQVSHYPTGITSPGFNEMWSFWACLNWLRTAMGLCKANLVTWSKKYGDISCFCEEVQAMTHLISCPLLPTQCTKVDLAVLSLDVRLCVKHWCWRIWAWSDSRRRSPQNFLWPQKWK